MLFSGSGNSTIKLWDKNTGDLLGTISGHGDTVRSVEFDSGNMLASGSNDRSNKCIKVSK